VFLALTSFAGCPKETAKEHAPVALKPDRGTGKHAAKGEDPAYAGLPAFDPGNLDPRRKPRAPSRLPAEVAVRFIRINYWGGKSAVRTRWSKAQADKRGQRLVQLARSRGSSFGELAKRFSEEPGATRGEIVTVRPGDFERPFEDAAFGLGIGQVSALVRTEFGHYVIVRVEPEDISTAHIVIMYQGSKNAPVGQTRTKEAARALAHRIQQKLAGPDVNFAVMAETYSDSPSKYRGGAIRRLTPGRVLPGLERYFDAASKLPVGAVSDVVETPFGFHLIKRLPWSVIWVGQVLIAFDGADLKPREKRTKAAAQELITKLRGELLAGTMDLAVAAARHSDDPLGKKGGMLKTAVRGELSPPKFEQHAFALKVGQLSAVIETRYGLHLIKRFR
jgi:parvulin-like peptidyl-prolyl isomerase